MRGYNSNLTIYMRGGESFSLGFLLFLVNYLSSYIKPGSLAFVVFITYFFKYTQYDNVRNGKMLESWYVQGVP